LNGYPENLENPIFMAYEPAYALFHSPQAGLSDDLKWWQYMCKEFNLKKSGNKSRVMPGKTSKPAGMRTASPIMNMSLVRLALQRSAEYGGSPIAENGATDLGQMQPLEKQVLFNHLQRFCGNSGAGILAGTSIVQSGGTETTRIQRMRTDNKNDEEEDKKDKKEDKSAEEIKGAGNQSDDEKYPKQIFLGPDFSEEEKESKVDDQSDDEEYPKQIFLEPDFSEEQKESQVEFELVVEELTEEDLLEIRKNLPHIKPSS